MPETSEVLDEFVDGVRRGDPDAISAVYLEVAPALRAYLRSEVHHGEVADDLVEHTFVELIESHDTIRGDGRALRTWLYRAARNNLYDWRRRAARRADHELKDELVATLQDGDPGPETVASERDALADIRDALDQLSPDQREVLQLRLVAELSTAEVAELTERTVGAVKALQHRGLANMARILESRTSEHR
ncbi:MAG TPA: sigma-70 family RNA polymerase sigma factor [Nitriliruptorales bacterium]|nr:sigma-70 family RNA polymerase sigma factor [Nitriliruptorales bacterium]